MNALLGGQVELTAGRRSTLISHIKESKLLEYFIWSGLFAPVATPAPLVSTLRDAARRAVKDADAKRLSAAL